MKNGVLYGVKIVVLSRDVFIRRLCDGAQRMLAQAFDVEAAEWIERHARPAAR